MDVTLGHFFKPEKNLEFFCLKILSFYLHHESFASFLTEFVRFEG